MTFASSSAHFPLHFQERSTRKTMANTYLKIIRLFASILSSIGSCRNTSGRVMKYFPERDTKTAVLSTKFGSGLFNIRVARSSPSWVFHSGLVMVYVFRRHDNDETFCLWFRVCSARFSFALTKYRRTLELVKLGFACRAKQIAGIC